MDSLDLKFSFQKKTTNFWYPWRFKKAYKYVIGGTSKRVSGFSIKNPRFSAPTFCSWSIHLESIIFSHQYQDPWCIYGKTHCWWKYFCTSLRLGSLYQSQGFSTICGGCCGISAITLMCTNHDLDSVTVYTPLEHNYLKVWFQMIFRLQIFGVKNLRLAVFFHRFSRV